MDKGQLRVLVQKEGDIWTAQCLEYDIGAQADDLETLKRRMDLTIRVEIDQSIARTGVEFGGIGPAPDYIVAAFEQTDATLRASSKTTPASQEMHANNSHKSIEYEMALCA